MLDVWCEKVFSILVILIFRGFVAILVIIQGQMQKEQKRTKLVYVCKKKKKKVANFLSIFSPISTR